MPVDYQVDIRAILRQAFDAISELCCSPSVPVHEHASSVLGLAWQTLNAIMELNSVETAKPDAIDCVGRDDETGTAFLAGWNLEKVNTASNRDDAWAAAKCLNTALIALLE